MHRAQEGISFLALLKSSSGRVVVPAPDEAGTGPGLFHGSADTGVALAGSPPQGATWRLCSVGPHPGPWGQSVRCDTRWKSVDGEAAIGSTGFLSA